MTPDHPSPLHVPGTKHRWAFVAETSNGRVWSTSVDRDFAAEQFRHRRNFPETHSGAVLAIGGLLVEHDDNASPGHTVHDSWGEPIDLATPARWRSLHPLRGFTICRECETPFWPPKLWCHELRICADCAYGHDETPRPRRFLQRRYGPPTRKNDRSKWMPGPMEDEYR